MPLRLTDVIAELETLKETLGDLFVTGLELEVSRELRDPTNFEICQVSCITDGLPALRNRMVDSTEQQEDRGSS